MSWLLRSVHFARHLPKSFNLRFPKEEVYAVLAGEAKLFFSPEKFLSGWFCKVVKRKFLHFHVEIIFYCEKLIFVNFLGIKLL